MAKKYTRNSIIELAQNVSILIPIREDIAAYFGIQDATASGEIEVEQKEIKAHTRNLLKTGLGGIATALAVEKHYYIGLKGGSKEQRGGKAIKVPTKLVTPAGNVRFATIRVPGDASNYAIALFIKNKFTDTAKKPDYFLTPGGKRFPVNVAVMANPNPGFQADETIVAP